MTKLAPWINKTRLTRARAEKHIEETPDKIETIKELVKAGKLTLQIAKRKIALYRAWATRSQQVIDRSLPIEEA